MVETISESKLVTCDVCGSNRATESVETQPVEYALSKDETVTIDVPQVPVISCSECECSYTDGRGEIATHDAICTYLGRLTSFQVKAIRGNLGLSRDAFSKATGIGAASLARWENAELIQSKSNDLLLRMVSKHGVELDQSAQPEFDSLAPDVVDNLKERGSRFQLAA